MNQELKAQAQQMRACAEAVDSTADVLAQAHQLRSQAADMTAQADALEQQAHDALGALGCYQPAAAPAAFGAAPAAPPAAPQTAVAPVWDGLKFVEAEAQ